MSMIKIQEYAMAAFKVAKTAHVDKGDKMSDRVSNTRKYWIKFAVDKKGYTIADASLIIQDAEDMADLELQAVQ
ncbi:hypothetical protein [Pseudomonas phage vB_PsaM_M1]|nr:hypothetical protein [Pseudomonas phage vB_PsaM_M1]